MRPVVFGPSPLMQAALGVFKGRELGRERVRDEEDRDNELATRDRKARMDALTLAHQTVTKKRAERELSQSEAEEARKRAAADRLRAHPVFNAGGKYGQPGDRVDVKHDYEQDFWDETEIDRTAKELMTTARIPEPQAREAAERDFRTRKQRAEAEKVKAEHEQAVARLELTKAQTKAAARDPFARYAETFRQQNERALADKWQKIYLDNLNPKYSPNGSVLKEGMSPAEAATKADEAMGGRPLLAPKVQDAKPAPMGTEYQPDGEQ